MIWKIEHGTDRYCANRENGECGNLLKFRKTNFQTAIITSAHAILKGKLAAKSAKPAVLHNHRQ